MVRQCGLQYPHRVFPGTPAFLSRQEGRPRMRISPLRLPTLTGFVLLSLIVHAGCAHKPPSSPDAAPPPVGSIGIVYAKFLPEVVLDLPAKGKVDGVVRGAGRGFLKWAEVPLRVGAEMMRGCSTKECGYVAIGFLALSAATGTVGAVVGGIHGSIRAIPGKEAGRMENAIRYLADLNIQETMWHWVHDATMDLTAYRILPLPESGPDTSDNVADYSGFASAGVDSVIEVSVLSVGFKGERWGRNPPLSVILQVRVRRYRTMDGTIAIQEEREFLYRSEERSFSEWMADGAARMDWEFQKGYRMLAGEIAEWI